MKPSFPVRHAPWAIFVLCLLTGGCQVLNASVDVAVDVPAFAQPARAISAMPAPQGPFDETPITPVETVGAARSE